MIVTTYTRPAITALGADGLPDYLSADRSDPDRWTPPQGYRLRVWCNGRELFHVVEADRSRGWVRTLPYDETPDGPRLQAKDSVTRLYHGLVTYRLERIQIGTRHFRQWLRRVTSA